MSNIYVRKSGNDSNNGSTPALAKLTIKGAVSAMTSGDTIYVGSGIYREGRPIPVRNKKAYIIGDITGEYTGDAGEVIISGAKSDDSGFLASTQNGIEGSAGLYLKNLSFQNYRLGDYSYVVYANNSLDIINCSFNNIAYAEAIQSGYSVIKFDTSLSSNVHLNIENVSISNTANIHIPILVVFSSTSGDASIKISNCKISSSFSADSIVGLSIQTFEGTGERKIENVEISNIYGKNSSSGVYINSSTLKDVYNCSVNMFNGNGITFNQSGGNAHNCSVMFFSGGTAYTNATQTNCVNKVNFYNKRIDALSKYSPLRGLGYTAFPTTDMDGNPRPAYGNGTACDIGVSESTSNIVQKESTVKDSGDFSMKVSPCNYFKREFQIPVTASELRTVKAKIRIDGTWGDYRPKITLSGQGMTASSSIKNATTGSFEELTVSGTPTTNGIALLTIEAHSANTDAVFYIDTITVE